MRILNKESTLLQFNLIDLTAYPELIEALPHVEVGFYRSPLTEGDRKIVIHSCPKTISVNYYPPLLNEYVSISVKKTDSVFYGIQSVLAQASRPIDYYFHRRIRDNPGLETSEDPEIMFARAIRVLLSYAVATVTHSMLGNLHKELHIPGKFSQLIESEIKPLIDQEALGALIEKKPHAKRHTFLSFPANSSALAPEIEMGPSDSMVTVHPPLLKNKARPETSKFLAEKVVALLVTELQDEENIFNLPHDLHKLLSDAPRPRKCAHVYSCIQKVSKNPRILLGLPLFPVSGPKIRAITDPADLHQDYLPSFTMDQVPRNTNLSILGRSTNHERIKRCVCENHTSGDGDNHQGNFPEGSEEQNPGSLTRFQQTIEFWPDSIEMSGEFYRESTINVNHSPTWLSNDTATLGAQ
ncbi:hypothetical protein AYI69_g4506 [Smittium culicis]|uniref:Uncharacterized protein n=1 Tax=Smittium culicis TaxID=133412 RepID=A0A1R1YD77_9FUNG|nr:hypothetical protein AYI69_g4506 [Smittium culicis]